MEIVLLTLDVIRNVAWTMYMGLVLAFALIGIFSKIDIESYLEWFRIFGVILGLSLGATLLPSIIIIWFERGSYYPQSTLETIGCAVGLGMWISNMVLEIWTLDPIRKYDLGILDEKQDIAVKRGRALTHIRVHALFCIGAYVCVLLNG